MRIWSSSRISKKEDAHRETRIKSKKSGSETRHGLSTPNKSLPSQKFQKSTIMKKCVKTIIQTIVSKVQITSKMARSSNMPAHIVFRRLGNFVNIRCKTVSGGVTMSRKIRKIPADGQKCQTGIGIRLVLAN